ncbi:MAG: acylphosphatase [Candidatus Micrarchaeia archaeon]
MLSRISIRIFGDVQGVFFRAGAQSEARKLGLKGWVRNVEDGSVEVLAEGESDILEKLLEWCMHGPAGAAVSHAEYEWQGYMDEFKGFEIMD